MRLFIAEKPSLAKAIAEGLPTPHKRDGDCIRCGNNDVVAWCVGHIMELAPPDQYDLTYKKWALDTLPIIPREWLLKVTNPSLYKNLEKLIRQADEIVNAGDPDREGQLLVDEVINAVGTSAPIKRVLINDLNIDAVKKALASIKNNSDFRGLSDAALSRSRADWLYGLNMTRLYTLLGRAGGYTEVLSVGRVQTPLLGLVVRRDLEIANFKPAPYFKITAQMQARGGVFMADWKLGDNAEQHLDDQGRLINQKHALLVSHNLEGGEGVVSSLDIKQKKENPPLPFALKDIQILASKKLNLSPDQTLEIVQSLYETHKVVTYPRSDCQYLPEGHLADVEQIKAAIVQNSPGLGLIIRDADLSLRSPAWNDKKVTAHHAIIPTPNGGNASRLSDVEKAVYELIATRYLMQFYSAHEYKQTQVIIQVNHETLTASGRVITNQGWRSISQMDDQDNEDNKTEFHSLPALHEGETVKVARVLLADKLTLAPKHFTDATLLAAMSGISRYVTDPKIKKLLKDSEGIGTPATQASIIKTLFNRQFIEKKGKAIHATEVGKSLINMLPESATIPDMTAFWEMAMNRIEAGEMPLDSFLTGIEKQINTLVSNGRSLGRLSIAGVAVHRCVSPGCSGVLQRRKGVNGIFWGCSNYPECKSSYEDSKGKPKTEPDPVINCPGCKTGELKKRKGANGVFWGCTRFKDGCKKSFNDYRGKPDFKGQSKAKLGKKRVVA